jgi:uncharacterized protein (DUF433 family)
MSQRSRGIRVSEPLAADIEREARRRARSWSATAAELLDEAMRMRRAPGIVFADGPAGRRAVVAGTGQDVWEVVATWQAVGEHVDALKASYPWLDDAALHAALGYYQLYPAEIDARLAREAEWTAERVRQELPFAARTSPRR